MAPIGPEKPLSCAHLRALHMPHKPSPTDQPEPIPLTVGDRTLASAYPLRGPGPREPEWSWRMAYVDPTTGTRLFRGLGRLAPGDVAQALVDAYREIDPSAIKEDGTHVRTVPDVIRAWFAHLEERASDRVREEFRIRPRTLISYKIASKQVLAVTEGLDARKLTTGDLLRVRDALTRDYAPRTARAALMALAQAMAWSKERGVEVAEVKMPVVKIKADTATYSRRTPTHEEVERVYSSLRRCGLRLALYVAWRTGARLGEVSSLTWRDIYEDQDGHWVKLTGKTGTRVFPLTADEVTEIRKDRPARATDDASLFTSDLKSISGQLAETCTRLGIEPFPIHGLRRLMTDTCQRRGVDIGTYAALMGHTPEVALKHYRQPTALDKRVAHLQLRRTSGDGVMAWLAQRGLTEDEAVELLESALKARGPKLSLVPNGASTMTVRAASA